MLGQERTVEDIERLREKPRAETDPFFVQYWNFLGRALQGDLGISYRQGRPPWPRSSPNACPATLELAAVSGMLALVFGIVLGVFTADTPRRMGPPTRS